MFIFRQGDLVGRGRAINFPVVVEVVVEDEERRKGRGRWKRPTWFNNTVIIEIEWCRRLRRNDA